MIHLPDNYPFLFRNARYSALLEKYWNAVNVEENSNPNMDANSILNASPLGKPWIPLPCNLSVVNSSLCPLLHPSFSETSL
jgi:hypothetical protein